MVLADNTTTLRENGEAALHRAKGEISCFFPSGWNKVRVKEEDGKPARWGKSWEEVRGISEPLWW